MDRRIRFWVSILLSFGQFLDLSIELFSEGSSGISVVKSWAVVLKWMYRFLTNFTIELCPISFENFEVISEISKLTRQLFTYVVRWRVHELRLGVFQTIFGHWCTQHGVSSNLPPTSLRWWLPCLYFRSLAPVLVVLIRRKETANIRRNNFPLVHKQGPKITYIADGFLVFVILWLLTFT